MEWKQEDGAEVTHVPWSRPNGTRAGGVWDGLGLCLHMIGEEPGIRIALADHVGDVLPALVGGYDDIPKNAYRVTLSTEEAKALGVKLIRMAIMEERKMSG